MKAISDYMALYEIWKAMDGPNWSYAGETYVAKSNWKFDGRPIDEWGNQPGVQVNADGRVKSLDLGSFNAKGDIPEALGKLTELESLWLGKHDDDLYETESVSYKLSKYSLYHKGVDLRKTVCPLPAKNWLCVILAAKHLPCATRRNRLILMPSMLHTM